MPWRIINMIGARQEFVLKAQRDGMPFAALCRQYGISRKTGYKWLGRAQEDGLFVLADRSRRPHKSATQTDEEVICRLVRLKLAHPTWGPKKIRVLYAGQFGPAPSLSTCHRVLAGKHPATPPSGAAGADPNRCSGHRSERCLDGGLQGLVAPGRPAALRTTDRARRVLSLCARGANHFFREDRTGPRRLRATV